MESYSIATTKYTPRRCRSRQRWSDQRAHFRLAWPNQRGRCRRAWPSQRGRCRRAWPSQRGRSRRAWPSQRGRWPNQHARHNRNAEDGSNAEAHHQGEVAALSLKDS